MSIYAGNLHVLQPAYTLDRATVGCDFCGENTPHLIRWYEWYSPHGVCLHCGQRYEDYPARERGPEAIAKAEQRARDAERELQEAQP